MISENFYRENQEPWSDFTSEEELLLSYEDYLAESSSYSLKAENHYDVELDDLNAEYDENDWEEEEE
ncbi:hypothetical protein [Flavobacterium sp. DG2-3]|uniref:hypothetical protein n=1 Tax=Flavobacterium sp. DG2-3 TaxID=3068317 RepID=UPI00273FE54B|nr:hypothetical protein [Flavobacterium sp. DG2-3]MDP5199052.1 hypothetical protein [Flavobacterium sp. DG2-3]